MTSGCQFGQLLLAALVQVSVQQHFHILIDSCYPRNAEFIDQHTDNIRRKKAGDSRSQVYVLYPEVQLGGR